MVKLGPLSRAVRVKKGDYLRVGSGIRLTPAVVSPTVTAITHFPVGLWFKPSDHDLTSAYATEGLFGFFFF